MTVKELIEHLSEYDSYLPVCDYEGSEISIVRLNYGDYDVAKDTYDGESYVVIL